MSLDDVHLNNLPIHKLSLGLPYKCDELSMSYCFELEFLVAKELPGVLYIHPSDNTNDSMFRQRWACPANEKDPCSAILNECKDLLIKNDQPVAVCYDPSCPDTETRWFNTRDFSRFGSWHLEPTPTARSGNSSPAEYEWLGVRLRSPLYPDTDLACKESIVRWTIGALRLGLILHVNSSCRFNVQVQPTEVPLSLLAAKKLTTLIWLVEKELLLRICPNTHGSPFCHIRPLETHSRVSTLVWTDYENSRPQDPLRAGIMDQYLPHFRGKALQNRLHFLWGIGSMQELVTAINCIHKRPASFALRSYGEEARPMAEFRYALWHPYGQLDATDHWIQLAINLAKITSYSSADFKACIKSIDHLITGFSANSVPPTARWKSLLNKLELNEDWAASWEKIIDEYKTGGKLSHPNIDKHGILGQMNELKVYERQ